MDAVCTYRIKVQGVVAENNLNVSSPLDMQIVQAEAAATLLTVQTDQSGVIGLIRYLHGQSFLILSIVRES